MMSFIKKFGKKHICSRFHSRFGDTSITAPDNGSWNQRPVLDTDGFAQLDVLSSTVDRSVSENVAKSNKSSSSSLAARMCLRDPGFHESSPDLGARPSEQHRARPKSQSRGRGRPEDERPRTQDERHERRRDESGSSRPGTANEHRSRGRRPATPARHFREEIPPSQNLSPPDQRAVSRSRTNSPSDLEETMESLGEELPYHPPLSITSRMRSPSPLSTRGEPKVPSRQTTWSSGPTASSNSNHTSPAMSSSSTPPSVYPHSPELTKIAYNPSFHKKRSRSERRKIRATQELVPSYDELYG